MTNIIALSDVSERCKVTIDAEKKKSMIVHFPNKMAKFRLLDNHLWGLCSTDETSYVPYEDCKTNKASKKLTFLSSKIYFNLLPQ